MHKILCFFDSSLCFPIWFLTFFRKVLCLYLKLLARKKGKQGWIFMSTGRMMGYFLWSDVREYHTCKIDFHLIDPFQLSSLSRRETDRQTDRNIETDRERKGEREREAGPTGTEYRDRERLGEAGSPNIVGFCYCACESSNGCRGRL